MPLLNVGSFNRIELTGSEAWGVNQVLSLRKNGSFAAIAEVLRLEVETGVENSKNALMGFEKLV